MNSTEIQELIAEGAAVRYPSDQFAEFEGFLTVAGWVPIKLAQVMPLYGPTPRAGLADIAVLDPDQSVLGFLCLCRQLGEVNVSSITDAQYAAYLADVPRDRFELPYRFEHDYLVVRGDRFHEYNSKYRVSSGIWGGFLHQEMRAILPFRQMPATITAQPDLVFPTPFHEESCIRSVFEPYAFERFLKLYHLFELLFDWDLVQRIQALGADLLGIGKLLAEYERPELERLKYVMGQRCTDVGRVCTFLSSLGNSSRHLEIARSVFFTFGKAGNPFSGPTGETAFNEVYQRGGFTAENLREARVNGFDTRKFDTFAISCAAYWIYRVRSSIAHNRIGEYVMTVGDESFVAEFAEPLIRELLMQALASKVPPGGAT